MGDSPTNSPGPNAATKFSVDIPVEVLRKVNKVIVHREITTKTGNSFYAEAVKSLNFSSGLLKGAARLGAKARKFAVAVKADDIAVATTLTANFEIPGTSGNSATVSATKNFRNNLLTIYNWQDVNRIWHKAVIHDGSYPDLTGAIALKVIGRLPSDPHGDLTNYKCSTTLTYLDLSRAVIGEYFNICVGAGELVRLELRGINLDETRTLSGSFSGMVKVKDLRLTGTNLHNTTIDVAAITHGLTELTTFILPDTFAFKHSDTLAGGFSGKTKLLRVNTDRWNVRNVVSFADTFKDCTSMTNLGVDNWDVSNGDDFSGFAQDATALATLNIGRWKFKPTAILDRAFKHCSSLEYGAAGLDVEDLVTSGSKVDYALGVPDDRASWVITGGVNAGTHSKPPSLIDAETITVTGYLPTFSAGLFTTSAHTIDLSGGDVSRVVDCYKMFDCPKLVSLKLPQVFSFDSLDDSIFNRYTRTIALFQNIGLLEELDLSALRMPKRTMITGIVIGNRTTSITKLSFGAFIHSKVTSIRSLLDGLHDLTDVTFTGSDFSGVNAADGAFENNSKLTHLVLPGLSPYNLQYPGRIIGDLIDRRTLPVSDYVPLPTSRPAGGDILGGSSSGKYQVMAINPNKLRGVMYAGDSAGFIGRLAGATALTVVLTGGDSTELFNILDQVKPSCTTVKVVLNKGCTIEDLSGAFNAWPKLRSLDVTVYGVAKVDRLASNCSKLERLSVSVTDIVSGIRMAESCPELSKVVLYSTGDTPTVLAGNLVDMTRAFAECPKLTSMYGLAGAFPNRGAVEVVTDEMFSGDVSLHHSNQIDEWGGVRAKSHLNWDAGLLGGMTHWSVTPVLPSRPWQTMTGGGALALNEVVEHVSVSGVVRGDLVGYLSGLKAKVIDISKLNIPTTVNISNLFKDNAIVTKIILPTDDRLNVITNASGAFSNCTSLRKIVNIQTTHFKDGANINYLFAGDVQLSRVTNGLDSWPITNYPDHVNYLQGTIGSMVRWEFRDVHGNDVVRITADDAVPVLTDAVSLRIIGTLTSQPIDLMGSCIDTITSVDLSRMKFSGPRSFTAIFAGCIHLNSVIGLDLSLATSIADMATGCGALTSAQITGVSASCTSMARAFTGTGLVSLDVSAWDTSGMRVFDEAFMDCYDLSSIRIDQFDFTSATSRVRMFYNCSGLDRETSHVDDVPPSTAVSTDWLTGIVDHRVTINTEDLYGVTKHINIVAGSKLVIPTGAVKVSITGPFLGRLDASTFVNAHVDLEELDLSGYTGTNIHLEGIFIGCNALTKVVLTGLDTSNCTTAKKMAMGCASLKSIVGISDIDTSFIADMSYMFSGSGVAESVHCAKFDTTSLTTSVHMYDVKGRPDVPNDPIAVDYTPLVPSTPTGRVSWHVVGGNHAGVFSLPGDQTPILTGAVRLTVKGAWIGDYTTLLLDCWDTIVTVNLSGMDTTGVTILSGMFSGLKKLRDLNLSGWDTSSVVSMDSMLHDTPALATLDISGWDTSNVEDMSNMFSGSGVASTVHCAFFNASSLINSRQMYGIPSRIDVPNDPLPGANDMVTWTIVGGVNAGTFKVVPDVIPEMIGAESITIDGELECYVDSLFAPCGNSLKHLDLSKCGTSKLTSLTNMFNGLGGIKVLDVSNFNLRNVVTINGTFANMGNLVTLGGLDVWDTSKVVNMAHLFSGCGKLRGVDFTVLDYTSCVSVDGLAAGCGNLGVAVSGIHRISTMRVGKLPATATKVYYDIGMLDDSSLSTSSSIDIDPIALDGIVNIHESTGHVNITGSIIGGFTIGDVVSVTVGGTVVPGTVSRYGTYSIPVEGSLLVALASLEVTVTATATTRLGGNNVIEAKRKYVLDLTPPVGSISINIISDDDVIDKRLGSEGDVLVSGLLTGDFVKGDVINLTIGNSVYQALAQ